MAKRSRSRSHTKRRKHRGGFELNDLNPMNLFKSSPAPAPAPVTVGEKVAEPVAPGVAPAALDAMNSAGAPLADAVPSSVAPEAPGVTPTGGRRRRKTRKTKRRRGGKYY